MNAPRGSGRGLAAAPTSGGEQGVTDASEWTGRVGGAWADEWRRIDRSFAPLTERLLDHPAMRGFAAALDVGCGAGEVSCRLAVGHPQSHVTGVDISPDLLAVARIRCNGPAFIEIDAASYRPQGPAPDLLLSRHGVMFFGDPVAAFAHLATIAAPRATLRFSAFRTRAENRWATMLGSVLPVDPAPADPHAPGPFAFGDRARVARILAESGWRDAEFESYDYPMLAGEGTDAVDEALAYFLRIGPAARAMADLDEPDRSAGKARLRELLAANCVKDRVALPAAAWIVTARAPG